MGDIFQFFFRPLRKIYYQANMSKNQNQTLAEIEEKRVVNEHYRNRIRLIEALLATSELVITDLCTHLEIAESSYHRYTSFTTKMKTNVFIHACLFLRQHIESRHIPYTQEEIRLIKALDLFQMSSNSQFND